MFIKVGFGQEYITCLLLRIASYFLCLSRPPLSLPRNRFLPCNRFLPPFLYLGKLSTLINIRQGLTHCHLLLQLVFVFRFAHLLLALLQQFLTHSLELLLQFLSRFIKFFVSCPYVLLSGLKFLHQGGVNMGESVFTLCFLFRRSQLCNLSDLKGSKSWKGPHQ